MKTSRLFLSLMLVLTFAGTTAFCGFYVAKAGAKLFNKTSQVILVRDGNTTSITMSSDVQGEVKDFAMVVPVPVVLKEDQIRIADPAIFEKLDAYSGPRLVEYFDENPCEEGIRLKPQDMATMRATSEPNLAVERAEKDLGVTVEAQYAIGEYDVLILSARESKGLKIWLTANGYQIPEQAEEVLDPYIKNKLKFFVVKVNLEEFARQEKKELSPIQMTFKSEKLMLPIRLGMANAEGDQDLIVYAFSRQGRVECTNYRTLDIPTDREIPTLVKDRFGEFYTSVFKTAWEKSGKNVVFNEYGWDISSSNYLKCDPCAGDPPLATDLNEAGVFWLGDGGPGNAGYDGDVYISRLHMRYNRETFPQDLQFQVTPNKENFQGRYVMNHPATGNLDCKAGKDYLQKLVLRRQEELKELASLTGWEANEFASYVDTYGERLPNYQSMGVKGDGSVAKGAGGLPEKTPLPVAFALIGAVALAFIFLIFRLFAKNN